MVYQLIVATFKQNVIKEYKRRQSTDSLLKANKLRDLQMVRVPMHIPTMTDDNDNCITPTTALSAVGYKEGDTVITENQSSSLSSTHGVNKYALQVWQPTDDEENWTAHLAGDHKEADIAIAENQSSSLASLHSVDKYALQLLFPSNLEIHLYFLFSNTILTRPLASFFFYGELYSLEKTYRDSQAYPHNPPYGHNVIKSSS
ncbi:hypothetical protein ACOSQ2_016447 [Xanthoceras sorbifolium]